MIELSPQPIIKEKLKQDAGMVMFVDFDISGVGGAEKSAKAILGYGKKADASWTLISPHDVAVPLDQSVLRIDGDTSRGDGDLFDDTERVRNSSSKERIPNSINF